MSGTDVDLDRLAEYAAGLLDPAASAEVERLIATEPAWADTLAALTAAQPLVRDALAGLASPPLPEDVAARLEAALPAPDTGPPLDTDAQVVPLSRRQRRAQRTGVPPWARTAATITAFAAGIAVCAGGIQLLRSHSTASNSGSSASDMRGNRPEAAAGASGLTVVSSGRNYTQQTVSSVGAIAASRGERYGAAEQPNPAASPTPSELARLAAPNELNTCLGLVSAAHGGTARTVDYARYQGQAALVVVLSGSGTGTGEVVVVGPKCGLPGSGTDQIYAAPLR